ncbi:MAG TPA: hypothetical protein VGQ08_09015 [Nitrospiraceae bacterium]|nr:hypothetical protein [Nitrospiraceae bacterium]
MKANRPVAIRMLLFAVVLFITLVLANRAFSTEAYFQFKDIDSNTFVFKLVDASTIKEAREILAKKLKVHVMGTLEKSPVAYNTPWHYHLKPETVSFFEITSEACDSSIQDVEGRLSDAGEEILPENFWCPWSSLLTKEVHPVSTRKK